MREATPIDRIDASSIASLHEAFIAAREEFEDAVRGAGDRWEEKFLEPEDGGDEAWPPHMAAAHALIGEQWRFRQIAAVLDQPPGSATLTNEAFAASPAGQDELAERPGRYEALSSAEATLATAGQVWSAIDWIYSRLENRDLTLPVGLADNQIGYLESQGQVASRDIRGCLTLAVVHLRDHAQQLRSAVAQ